MVTYEALLIGVVHAGETDEGNTSHAEQEREGLNEQADSNSQGQVIGRISRLSFQSEV